MEDVATLSPLPFWLLGLRLSMLTEALGFFSRKAAALLWCPGSPEMRRDEEEDFCKVGAPVWGGVGSVAGTAAISSFLSASLDAAALWHSGMFEACEMYGTSVMSRSH